MTILNLDRLRELAGLPVLKEGSSFNNPIDDSTEEDLWKYLLWALAQTTKDPSKTIKDLLKKGLKLSDSSVVDSIAGTNVSKQITEHLQLWQKLQTSKQKLLVSFKLLEKSLGHLYDEKEPLEEVNSIIAARQAAVQETSREAERNFMRAQAKLDREQPIPVPSSWENDALGNTTLFLSLEETLRSYNIAEVGTDRSRQNVFIQFTPKEK